MDSPDATWPMSMDEPRITAEEGQVLTGRRREAVAHWTGALRGTRVGQSPPRTSHLAQG